MASDPEGPTTFERLTPEIIGTKLGDLVTPCDRYQRSWVPPRPDAGPPIAVALSGGGFRATLAGLGVLRFLADAGVLGQVRYVSSVSGGSIANGLLARRYEELRAGRFSHEAFADRIERPTLELISERSLTMKLVANVWRIVGPKTRTMLLADAFDEWFFKGMVLEEMPLPVRYVINAANLTSGVRFGFERERIGDYVVGTLPTSAVRVRLAEAVAASAAVPGVLAAYTPKGVFPCQRGVAPRLVDGGAYENTGLEPVDDLPDTFLIALNAGGIFRTGPIGWLPIVRDLQRSEGLLYRQSTGLRMRQMVERFRLREHSDPGAPPPKDARWGVLFGLATTIVPGEGWPPMPFSRGEQLELAQLKTSFARFPIETCRRLIRLGWWMTGANISRYHPDLLRGRLPEWRD